MPGLGPRQIILIWFGSMIAVSGFFLASSSGRRFIFELFLPNIESTPQPLILIAIWFALLTGLVEVIVFGFRKAYYAQYLGMSLHLSWMIPVAELIIFSAASFILYILSKIWSKFGSLGWYVTVFTFLFGYSIFSLFPLQNIAMIILAVGIALQAGRVVSKKPLRYYWLVKRTLPWLMTMAVVLLIIMIIIAP